jgi:hypothetical protein
MLEKKRRKVSDMREITFLDEAFFGQTRYGKSMKIADLIIDCSTKEKVSAENI